GHMVACRAPGAPPLVPTRSAGLARAEHGLPLATISIAVSARVVVAVRSRRLGRLAWVAGGIAAAAGLLAVLATARPARVEPTAAMAPDLSTLEPDNQEGNAPDLSWTLAGEPIERLGYRHGHRHILEVVPLGPTA